MNVSHLEYLVFSGLSYCYFNIDDIGKSITEILSYSRESKENQERILIKNELFKTMNYFETWQIVGDVIAEELCNWEVLDILDRTDFGVEEEKTGFYAITFGKRDGLGAYSDIVIAYRGSQLFPIKEAYRDFIETDLKIGLGKKPKQFDEGLEAYVRVIEKFDYKKVHLTGHSLGGGIAQYTAVMAEHVLEDKDFVPYTVAFNSIGILVEGMIRLEEFIELNKTKEYLHSIDEDCKWDKIKSALIFYLKTKAPFIKSSTKLLPIPDDFGPQKLKVWDIERVAVTSQLKLVAGLALTDDEFDKLIDTLFDKEELYNELNGAMVLLDNFHDNKKYVDRVKNYSHSNDFTATYFPHIGKTIYVDKNLEEREGSRKREFLKTFMIFQTMVKQFHLFDVFIPFIARNNGMNILAEENQLSTNLSIRYVASSLRKMIYREVCSQELIITYYKRFDRFNRKDIDDLKHLISDEFLKAKDLFIYHNHLADRVKNLSDDEFLAMWFDSLDRLPSPFEYQDIYDYVNYVFAENTF